MTQSEKAKKLQRLANEAWIKDSLIQEFNSTLNDRVKRYLSIRRLKIVPLTDFSNISSECALLYRDGYYFACISLCQSVAESFSRFMCSKNYIRTKAKHETRVRRLKEEKKISEKAFNSFVTIHESRDDFHHFNPNVPTQKVELQEIALNVLAELCNIEKEVFESSIQNGAINPKNIKYWKDS